MRTLKDAFPDWVGRQFKAHYKTFPLSAEFVRLTSNVGKCQQAIDRDNEVTLLAALHAARADVDAVAVLMDNAIDRCWEHITG